MVACDNNLYFSTYQAWHRIDTNDYSVSSLCMPTVQMRSMKFLQITFEQEKVILFVNPFLPEPFSYYSPSKNCWSSLVGVSFPVSSLYVSETSFLYHDGKVILRAFYQDEYTTFQYDLNNKKWTTSLLEGLSNPTCTASFLY